MIGARTKGLAMTDYPLPEIRVLAKTKTKVRVGSHAFAMRLPWGPAEAVKARAARELRALDLTGGDAHIELFLWQKSPDVPWTDGGTWWWDGAAEIGSEYGAQWLEVFPTWGGGR